jgi:SAM-dependent methyltransferase
VDDSGRIRSSYDAIAGDYADKVGPELSHKPLDRALLRAFTEMLPDRDSNCVVADVGCGPGHVTAFLAPLGPRVIGIDVSPGMVETATQRYPDLEFRIGSLLELDVPDRALSGVVAMYSLIHLADSEFDMALRELHRVLRPGGLLLVAIHTEHLEHSGESVIHMEEWWGHPVDLDFHFRDSNTVKHAVVQMGFAIEAILQREPNPEVEAPTRRAYILSRRPMIA